VLELFTFKNYAAYKQLIITQNNICPDLIKGNMSLTYFWRYFLLKPINVVLLNPFDCIIENILATSFAYFCNSIGVHCAIYSTSFLFVENIKRVHF
jgi:hypothetical protein